MNEFRRSSDQTETFKRVLSRVEDEIKERYQNSISMGRGRNDAVTLAIAQMSVLQDSLVDVFAPLEHYPEEVKEYANWTQALFYSMDDDWSLMRRLIIEKGEEFLDKQEEESDDFGQLGHALLNLAKSI